ncbi:Ankyrin repeat-containing protein [Oopsacas minuta]|uniref:Ankyrin repeat-containing protein n=1 Tax=Oopsacas minuta TaxID=111878 RepID=A0AAV7JD90_9METZ|nr:Ankyrin repeat-containing protein [Oopsacas minuta]
MNRYGTTDLHIAAGNGEVRNLESMLSNGRDPNIQNNIGYTPLHTAVVNGELQCVEILIAHHSSPFVTDSLGHTPLDKISIVLKYKENFNDTLISQYELIHRHLKAHIFKPLTHLCRDKILSCLVSLDDSVIQSLPTPHNLQNFLHYRVPEEMQLKLYKSTRTRPIAPCLRLKHPVSNLKKNKCSIM